MTTATTKNISILLVDDHQIFMDGVRSSFNLEDDFEVLGTVSNGDDALSLISDLEPTVVLLDVLLDGDLNGMEITSQLRNVDNPPYVLLITGYDDHEQALHAIRAGAAGYCNKGIHIRDLIQMIRHVAQGQYVVHGEVFDEDGIIEWAKRIYQGLGIPDIEEAQDYFRPLTNREMEILRLVTLGYSNHEVARELKISRQTVKNHMTSIFRKLYVQDRTQAAVFAISHGWVRMEDARNRG